ncbi:MAG: hypothetical protein FJX45_13605 [Alphaproteobacteria bacterium]|nr:hypothetical protein [Alphaproteobacteria bacterium]
MTSFNKTLLVFCLFTWLSSPSFAEEENNRLLIVNGNSGHVIYDDGRDDLFCVTRRRVVGYNDYGRRIWRRTMRCR